MWKRRRVPFRLQAKRVLEQPRDAVTIFTFDKYRYQSDSGYSCVAAGSQLACVGMATALAGFTYGPGRVQDGQQCAEYQYWPPFNVG